MTLMKKLRDHQSHHNSSKGDLKFQTNISWQSIQWLSRYFNQNHRCHPHGGTRVNIRVLSKLMCFILWEQSLSIQKFAPVDVEIFHWMSENFDLQVALELESQDHQSQQVSSSWDLECLYIISRQFIQQQYFSLDQSGRSIYQQAGISRTSLWLKQSITVFNICKMCIEQ